MANTADSERYLSGGTMTPVVRVGATVHRATGPWSCTVHQLLRHLADAGFDGAPRYLGTDPQGREILSFIDGEVTAECTPVGLYESAALTGAARLLRQFHDATLGFPAAHAEGWQIQIGAPTTGPVICHNEIGPYNTVYRSGRPIAFIDWDFAAPGPREWDVAYALWRFVPLYDDETCAELGWPTAPRGPRIARFLDAYGLDDRRDLLSILRQRQEAIHATIAHRADQGDPVYVNLRREGRLDHIAGDMDYAARSRDEWMPYLQ
jgi:hypothetical protein